MGVVSRGPCTSLVSRPVPVCGDGRSRRGVAGGGLVGRRPDNPQAVTAEGTRCRTGQAGDRQTVTLTARCEADGAVGATRGGKAVSTQARPREVGGAAAARRQGGPPTAVKRPPAEEGLRVARTGAS